MESLADKKNSHKAFEFTLNGGMMHPLVVHGQHKRLTVIIAFRNGLALQMEIKIN